MTDAPTRLPGLDGIRALAVLLVIFHHLCSNGTFAGWPAGAYALKRGIFGVQVFFVLSGFLIAFTPSAWPALVAASFACAAGSYYLVEQPALAWRDRTRQG